MHYDCITFFYHAIYFFQTGFADRLARSFFFFVLLVLLYVLRLGRHILQAAAALLNIEQLNTIICFRQSALFDQRLFLLQETTVLISLCRIWRAWRMKPGDSRAVAGLSVSRQVAMKRRSPPGKRRCSRLWSVWHSVFKPSQEASFTLDLKLGLFITWPEPRRTTGEFKGCVIREPW